MVHQDRAKSRTRERERDQTHSYKYIPSAPRVNYSLHVMESARMMKMTTNDDSPLRQGAGTGSREVFGGYRGLRRRNSWSRLFSGGLGIYRRGWRREKLGGPTERPRGTGARPRGWVCPPPSWGPWDSPPVTLHSSIFLYFPEKISVDFQRIPRTFISAQKQYHGSPAENSVSPG